MNYAPGTVNTFSSGTVSAPNRVITHPLAGGDNVQNNPTNYWTPDPANTTNGRWISARTVRCGIRIIPSANITVKQGVITFGCIPGKTYNARGNGTVSIPSVN